MRKILSILLLIILLATPVSAAGEKVNVIVKGRSIDNYKAEVIEGRTFVPVRAISEKLGAKVDYFHERDRQIVIAKDNYEIILNIGKLEAKLNSGDTKLDIKLDVKPYLKEDVTMVPLRFISEALGEDVEWDPKSNSAIIGNLTTKEVPKDYEKIELKPLNGSVFFPKSYTKDIEISTKALTEGDVTIISKKLKEKSEIGTGTLIVLNNSRMPIIDSDHGYNIYYNPVTENFVTAQYPLPSSFPKDIREEIAKLQKDYLEMLSYYFQPLVLLGNMDNLKWSKDNQKIWNTLDIMKNMFLPRNYFYYNIPYTDEVESGKLVYLYNDDEMRETTSKVELIFDKGEKLIKYSLKFYEPAKDLDKSSTVEDGIKTIKLFQELVLGYEKENLPEVKLYSEKTINIYEKGVHEQYKDANGNIYVFDLTKGLLEYYSNKID